MFMGCAHYAKQGVRLVFAGVFALAIWVGANVARADNLPAAVRPTEAGSIVAWGEIVFDSAELATDDFTAIAAGGYHNLAMFFDRVARLSRIVNILNVNIQAPKTLAILNASCVAMTYRFLEAAQAPPAGAQ